MLGIVTIDYKNPQMTIDFCRRELPSVDVEWVCCVVVNGATPEEVSQIAEGTGGIVPTDKGFEKDGQLFILPSEENLGFARGNNLGVEFLLSHFKCEHLLFSNTDIEIKTQPNVSRMLKCLEEDESRGAVGPLIYGLDGFPQSPHYAYVSPYRQIGWHLLPFLRRKKREVVDVKDVTLPQDGYAYWLQGSFFVMRTDDFVGVGMFDPHTFLYGEEPILAERLKTKGKRMWLCTAVHIVHYEGGTILKAHSSARSERWVMESNCYYYRRYLHYSCVTVWLYKTSFLINKFFTKRNQG